MTPLYHIYYATDQTNREFNKDTFIAIAARDRVRALHLAFDMKHEAVKWGAIVEVGTVGDKSRELAFKNGTIRDSQSPAPDTVKVSFWKSGARAGKFSQKTYPVLDRTPERVQVELMPGMPKWFPVGQVQAA